MARGKAGFHKRLKARTRQSGLNDGKSAEAMRSAQSPKLCPLCQSELFWKDGLRRLKDGSLLQRYICRSCGFRFSDSAANRQVEVDVSQQRLILPEAVENLRKLDSVKWLPVDEGFKDPPFTFGEDVGSHRFTSVGKTINSLLHNSSELSLIHI